MSSKNNAQLTISRPLPAAAKPNTPIAGGKNEQPKITPFPPQQCVKVVNRLISFLETK